MCKKVKCSGFECNETDDRPVENVCALFFKNLKMRKQNRLKSSHFLRLPGRLLEKAASGSWKVPFSRENCDLIACTYGYSL